MVVISGYYKYVPGCICNVVAMRSGDYSPFVYTWRAASSWVSTMNAHVKGILLVQEQPVRSGVQEGWDCAMYFWYNAYSAS
jgi:hypothetical protein